MERRSFLANITTAASTLPFIGAVKIASAQEVNKFGKPGLDLEEKNIRKKMRFMSNCFYCYGEMNKILNGGNVSVVYFENGFPGFSSGPSALLSISSKKNYPSECEGYFERVG